MNKITISENKTLKLQNVISSSVDLTSEEERFDEKINKMNIAIRTHGAKQVGPLIQYSSVKVNENNEPDLDMRFMLQSDNYIHGMDGEYNMDSVIRVKNCLYARYFGPESKVKFAYDKLGVYAFENDIELDGSNYTVFVDQNEENETLLADIFMPVKE